LGYDQLLQDQIDAWAKIWDMSDITIDGDVKAKGIRFNIFQLNQTYLGKDSRLNIGPKVLLVKIWRIYLLGYRSLLHSVLHGKQRPRSSSKLIDVPLQSIRQSHKNAAKLGFTNGAALYPMVTMNGEECHNEWEITFEEIHRNGAIAFAIYNFYRYTRLQLHS
jgi:maltose phosphorylase